MFNWMGVSKSGYYEWHGRPDSVTARRRAGLKELIQQVFDEFDETYGYRRIHAELNRRGVPCGPELIRALVRELGLVACQPRPWRLTTIPDADVATTPDLVKRNFTANEPGAKLVGDITYVKTWNGWLYLATVIDCYTKMVVGYAMATHMETSLIRAAIDMAARNISLPKDAIFHSDRGSQYTSSEYRKHLQELRIRPSLGLLGPCPESSGLPSPRRGRGAPRRGRRLWGGGRRQLRMTWRHRRGWLGRWAAPRKRLLLAGVPGGGL